MTHSSNRAASQNETDWCSAERLLYRRRETGKNVPGGRTAILICVANFGKRYGSTSHSQLAENSDLNFEALPSDPTQRYAVDVSTESGFAAPGGEGAPKKK